MVNITEYCIMFISTSDYNNAEDIARMLVSERLAACCSIVQNISSIYIWNESVEKSQECLIIIKTHKSMLDIIESKVSEMHPYKVPEIISFDLSYSSSLYLNWLDSVLIHKKINRKNDEFFVV